MTAIHAPLAAAFLALGLIASAHAQPANHARAKPTKPEKTSPTSPTASPEGERAEADRADIDRAAIVGNRELPKVLHIVPWKKPVPGELAGRPVSSVLDEALAPIDRDVFRRQIDYDAQARAQINRAAPPR